MKYSSINVIFDALASLGIDTYLFFFTILFVLYYIYSIKSKIIKEMVCPHCKNDKTYRTSQNFIEQNIFHLGNYKKYKCVKCATCFYIRNFK